jgi:hypothetical protein
LNAGVSVVIAAYARDGFHRALIAHSCFPGCRGGGLEIMVSDHDIAEGRNIALPDEVMTGLISAAPINGPIMEPEEFGRIIAARAAGNWQLATGN